MRKYLRKYWQYSSNSHRPLSKARKAKKLTCMKKHERMGSHISFLDVPCIIVKPLVLTCASSPSSVLAYRRLRTNYLTRINFATITVKSPSILYAHNKPSWFGMISKWQIRSSNACCFFRPPIMDGPARCHEKNQPSLLKTRSVSSTNYSWHLIPGLRNIITN